MKFRQGSPGFVLVVALGALAVMTILLLALLQGAGHQVRGAESDAATAREKMLADSAVAQVIGQIEQASTQPGVAWISQPGLLRTYTTGAARTPATSYKLYSATTMTDTSGSLAFLAGDIPADWNSTANQNLYIDLNAPQQTSGATIYPILNPAAFTGVEGVSSDSGSVAMPVMWLYQLQDGTLGPASNGTKTNPIVGRIAFWADDETCKININTAGCGSAWNTPRSSSPDDVTYSTTQSVVGEFTRYAGHPATTSLAPVFGFGANALSPQSLLGLTPRYAWGGSQGGTETTVFGQAMTPKADRLYASLDELCFGTSVTGDGQRTPSAITPTQLEQARFVLTAHSVAPETTLTGEPRIAIWPVADAPDDPTRTTATDRAIESVATVGPGDAVPAEKTRHYYFQRHEALSATTDLDASTAWGGSNMQLFNELVARGGEAIPGCSATFLQKYSGTKWSQLMLEIVDFIRGLNAIDPSPAPLAPFAHGDLTTGFQRGFIIPLTTLDAASGATLRGLGRCPTLTGLTLVFYVSGFGFKDGTFLDFEDPANATSSVWQTNFDLASPTNRWKDVTSELIRAFVVPTTYHPGCAFPEVSDGCDIQITGLDGINVSSARNDFAFISPTACAPLGTPLKVLSPDRAWGGNEGSVAWRAAGDAFIHGDGTSPAYPFEGTQRFILKLSAGSIAYNATTHKLTWPALPNLAFQAFTVNAVIRDATRQKNVLQTLSLSFPACTLPAPTIQDEGDHFDHSTDATSDAQWNTNPALQVAPYYYMNFENRLQATQRNRPFLIQPGDVTRTVEAGKDYRLIAGLSNVPSALFQPMAGTTNYGQQRIAQIHNIRFADGTSACGAWGSGGMGTFDPLLFPTAPNPTPSTVMVSSAGYACRTISGITGTDDSTGQSVPVTNAWFIDPSCGAPIGKTPATVTMAPGPNINGDWDTGPGLGPDGPQINLPDAGTSLDPATAYFSLTGRPITVAASFNPTRFSPNALVPSPVIFGSLPAGIDPVTPANSQPWRTLLFCPNPASNYCAIPPAPGAVTASMHPGFGAPPDYLLLDHFWMPTVEPYALSTRMATAGKINLNDQIAPFTYLHRNTALRALFDGLRIPAIPLTTGSTYKTAGAVQPAIWQQVDPDATLQLLEAHDVFLSEGEICTVPMVPKGVDPATLSNYWNQNATGSMRLTGDNLRELPYAQLYSRLATRSNSYTVHVHVQVLQKRPSDPDQNVWKEGTDVVLGDWRGAYEIERYLDPAAQAPDAATGTTPGKALGPYRFRIVSSQRFAP